MLPPGTNYFASGHGLIVSPKTAIYGRKVVSNTPKQMAFLVTSGPKSGLIIWLTWASVVATLVVSPNNDQDFYVTLTNAGVDFMHIYFTEPTNQETA
jgi:hypothetical protein